MLCKKTWIFLLGCFLASSRYLLPRNAAKMTYLYGHKARAAAFRLDGGGLRDY